MTSHQMEGLEDIHSPMSETTTLQGGLLGKRVSDLLILEPGRLGGNLLTDNLPPPPRKYPQQIRPVAQDPPPHPRAIGPSHGEGEVPESMEVKSSDIETSTSWKVENGAIEYRRVAKLHSSRIEPERYAEFRDRTREINAINRQAVVLVPE